jgi:predicted ribosome quality control (RQC) complex YloA/Tae2 family protein
MKQRFSSLDVRIIAHELSTSLVTLRLANIYDLSSRIFLLKFAKPDRREQFIIDSGFRCHLTEFGRATATTPSPFVARLRKFLRTRRVTSVEQIGTDRVLEIRFSDGAFRLFLEFYAGGNIVLTDNELTILALLRSVNEGEEHEQYRQGLKYNLSLRQNYDGVPELTKDRLRDGLQKAAEKQAAEAQKSGKKIKKKPGDALRKALAVTTTEFPPILIDHALHVSKFDRTLSPEDVIGSESLLDNLLQALKEAQNVIQEITSKQVTRGYILAKRGKGTEEDNGAQEEHDSQNLLYDDFHAFKPAQLAEDSSIVFLEHEGFNSTVDDFFSSIEGQRVNSRLQEREDQAKRKIETARQEQTKRLDGLQQVQELNVRKAQAIEANVERVDEAVAAVNGLIAQGMDWADIGKLIENEQKRHNAVAEMIKLPLKLHENTITLLLAEIDGIDDDEVTNDETDSDASDSEDDAPTRKSKVVAKPEEKRLSIDVDLAVSAWSNARQYYDQKRTAAVKQEKTAQSSAKALKSTEQKVMADLKKGLKQEKEVLRQVRRQLWFEKFIYFISSDGYLVLAGRDIQQSEILYRRYLKKGDAYVHADLPGAASVIIKNKAGTPEAPIPPSTLSQAGSLSVCTSNAWESKAIMSAWWVNADQVSKTAATGEYLAAGDFSIRGEKNFLPPAQLLLGFAVMFRISEDSKQRHAKHRVQDLDDKRQASIPAEQEETSEPAGVNDGEDQAGSDDDFSDAHVASAAGAVDTDGDDDFPDAAKDFDGTDDEFPDARSAAHGETHDEDEDKNYRSANPLQSGHHESAVRSQKGNDDEENDDDDDDDDEDDEDAEHGEEDLTQQGRSSDGQGHKEKVPDSSSGDQALGEPADSSSAPGAEAGSGETQLSNRERKAQTRAEQGKPPAQNSTPSKQHLKGLKGRKRKTAAKYAKYALQDDDEREIAMRLLGSKTAKDTQEAEVEAQTTKSETVEEARARRKAQHDKTQREGLEAEEKRRKQFLAGEGGDDLEDDDDEDAHDLVQLDELIGTPLPGDEILEAIPVCAPWTALSKYKYKAKLQPGQQKKGKATREIVGKWTKDGSDSKKVDQQSSDVERIWPRETELLKSWKEAEIVGIIPVKNVRVMMSGGNAEKAKGGSGGKSGRGGKGSKRR